MNIRISIHKILVLIVFIIVLPSCTITNKLKYLYSNSKNYTHTVKKGETLYSISKKYKINFKKIANANKIKAPYLIKAGKKILIPNRPISQKLLANNKTTVKSISKPAEKNTAKPLIKTTPKTLSLTTQLNWAWPAKGKVISEYVQGQTKRNGIAIVGMLGDPVVAAAGGVVIYSGDALRGYGNLIIIKHNENYLTAYAHNQKIIVKEKEVVRLGQKIATMGNTDSDKVKLHFEIRYNGKPINPMQLLPS